MDWETLFEQTRDTETTVEAVQEALAERRER
jgi:hypothetical protein